MLIFNQVPGSVDAAGPAARRVGGSRTDQGELALTQAPTPLLTSCESPVCSLAHPHLSLLPSLAQTFLVLLTVPASLSLSPG